MNALSDYLPNIVLSEDLNEYSESVSSRDLKSVLKILQSRDFGMDPKGKGSIIVEQDGKLIKFTERGSTKSKELNEVVKNFNGPDSMYSQYFAAELGVGFKLKKLDNDVEPFATFELVEQKLEEDFRLILQTESKEIQYLADDLTTCIETIDSIDGVVSWEIQQFSEDVSIVSSTIMEDALKTYNLTFNDYKKGKISKDEYIKKANELLQKLLKDKKAA